MGEMEGRSAIVTGGGTGLGAAISRRLALLGANVCVNYLNSERSANEVAKNCGGSGVDAFAAQADVRRDEDCRRLIDHAVERFGRLDVVVNNAGTTVFADHARLELLDANDFRELYDIHVIAAYQMARAAKPHFGSGQIGSIVNVSSIAGVAGIGSSIAYAAAKGALNTMTLSLARAMAPSCRVNAVCPGFIESGWFSKHAGPESEKKAAIAAKEKTPLRQASTPEDIADVVAFLAGPGSRHMTGETVLVDAGLHLGFA